jgi:hypothetical protein
MSTPRPLSEVRVISGVLPKITLMISSFALAIFSLSMIAIPPDVSPNWPVIVASGFMVWGLFYLIASYYYFRTMYLFATAYVISLAVFHLGHIFAYITSLYDLKYLIVGDMAFWNQQAGWYCNLAFACLGIGIALSLRSVRSVDSNVDVSPEIINRNITYAFWIGFALMLAALVGLLLVAATVGNIMQFSRAEIFGGVGDTRGFGFFLIMAPSAMVLMVTTARSSLQKNFTYAVCFVIAFFILFFGYRSELMFPSLVGAILWVKLGRKIPILVAIILLVSVLIMIPAVSHLRAQGAYEDLSGNDVAAAISQSEKPKRVLLELGGVSSVVAYVLKTVPEEWPYRLGQSYWLAFEQAIPNLGLQIVESQRAAVMKKAVDKNMIAALPPADWYTYIVNRWMFNHGGGAGFSTIAEAYLNFGLIGVAGYFSILGFLLGRLDQIDLRMRPRFLVFSGAMLWPLMKTVRNSFGVFLKPVAFVLVTIFIWQVATFWMAKRK